MKPTILSINSVPSFKPLLADYKNEYNAHEYFVELIILMVQRTMKLGVGASVDYLASMSAVSLAAYCKSEIESERARGVIYNLQDHIMCTANKLTHNGLC